MHDTAKRKAHDDSYAPPQESYANATWLAAAAGVNYVTYSMWTLLNKWQFERLGTTCPVLSTASQMLVAGAIACGVSLAMFGRVSSAPPGKLWDVVTSQILPLGVARAIDIGCGNAALSLVTVALQQILKSLLPLFVCVLSFALLKKRPSGLVWLSLAPIVVGSLLAAMPDHAQNLSQVGIALALVSTAGRSLKAVLNARLLAGSQSALPLRPLEVLSLEAPTSGALLLCVSVLLACTGVGSAPSNAPPRGSGGDGEAAHQTPTGMCGRIDAQTFAIVNCGAGVLMFFNQLSYISVIKLSSALTCQVLMNMKMLLLIVVSLFVFHTQLSGPNVAGVVVAASGCLAYAVSSTYEVTTAAASKRREETV